MCFRWLGEPVIEVVHEYSYSLTSYFAYIRDYVDRLCSGLCSELPLRILFLKTMHIVVYKF